MRVRNICLCFVPISYRHTLQKMFLLEARFISEISLQNASAFALQRSMRLQNNSVVDLKSKATEYTPF